VQFLKFDVVAAIIFWFDSARPGWKLNQIYVHSLDFASQKKPEKVRDFSGIIF